MKDVHISDLFGDPNALIDFQYTAEYERRVQELNSYVHGLNLPQEQHRTLVRLISEHMDATEQELFKEGVRVTSGLFSEMMELERQFSDSDQDDTLGDKKIISILPA